MKFIFMAFFSVLVLLACLSCDNGKNSANKGHGGVDKGHGLRVVTTLYPLYDFARAIGGDRAEVTLLLPPGMEAHGFEPKPADIVRVNGADLFVYTNPNMEPWAGDIIGGIDKGGTLVVDASAGARMLKAGKEGGPGHGNEGRRHDGHRHGEGMDPHLWLDFGNARIMVDNILAGFVARDPRNSEFYTANAEAYKSKLKELDNRYRSGLATCGKRIFLHGGHFAFGYLANRYGLHYESAYAVGADAEPSPAKIASLISRIRASGLRYIYTEELVEPRVADVIARETGTGILKLHGAHNISRDELAAGVTFFSLMEANLNNLKIGLECR